LHAIEKTHQTDREFANRLVLGLPELRQNGQVTGYASTTNRGLGLL